MLYDTVTKKVPKTVVMCGERSPSWDGRENANQPVTLTNHWLPEVFFALGLVVANLAFRAKHVLGVVYVDPFFFAVCMLLVFRVLLTFFSQWWVVLVVD